MATSHPAVDQIFAQALEGPAGQDRLAFVQAACGSNVELRQRVERMLRAYGDAESFLESPAAAIPAATLDQPVPEGLGTQIGPYKLLQQIGEGGMGTVYLAEQMHPMQRKVALKLIKAGMDSRQVIARFEAERQALAMMDHVNIARVLDAGTTGGEPGGVSPRRPYFVMELVHGVPITKYCDDNHLTPRERLELFVPVCQAIQHAHQKGIIHRDIKPSNVMITLYDGKPVPKVIDFGVAKAIEQPLTERTLFTQYGTMVGTLEYMSPEQAEMSALGVDTRSDIFSLGVLLYELLTGSTPLRHQRIKEAAFAEILRLIKEEEPPKPSTRLSDSGEALASISAQRHMEPAKLAKLMRGELDWIVMKCLEKDRNRRYETANGFAADVLRYLNDEPVQACPPSASYKLCKFVRRNKATVLGAGLVLVSLIGGIVGTTWQAVRATTERNQKEHAREESVANERRAVEEAANALNQQALAQHQSERAENNFRLAREAVDQMLTRVAEEMSGKPHMEQIRRALLLDALKFYQGFLQQKGADPSVRLEAARANLRVGRIHMLLGQLEQAEAPLEQAVELMQKLFAEFPAVSEYRSELADAHNGLAGLFADHTLNRPRERLEHALAALAVRKLLVADFPDRQQLRRDLAAQLLAVGVAYSHGRQDTNEGERYLQDGLAAVEEIQKESPDDRDALVNLSRAHHWLGWLFKDTGRLSEAEAEFRKELAIRAAAPDGRPVRFYDSMTKAYLAGILVKTGRPEEAEQLLRDVIAYREKVLDDFPDDYDQWRRLSAEYELLGHCLVALEHTDEAERVFRRSLEMAQKLAADFRGAPAEATSYRLAWRHYDLGLFLQDTNRIAEAADMFRQAQLLFEENAAKFPGSPTRLSALAWFLADCPATQFRDPQRAVELANKVLQLEPQSGRWWGVLGIAQARAGQWPDANESIRKAMELSSGGDSRHWFFLAIAQWHLGSKPQSREWYDQAVRWMESHRRTDEELRRFRAEAEALTGFKQQN